MITATERLLESKDKIIRILTILVVALGALLGHAHFSVMKMPNEWTFYTPPNIDSGGQVRIGQVPGVEAFNFAFTMWVSVNTWLSDGSLEYSTKLDQYRNYFSADFIAAKKLEAQRDSLSLKKRKRTMELVDGAFTTKPVKANTYEVTFDVRVVDTLGDIVVIDEIRRYSFLVVPFKVPRKQNPWQLRVKNELRDYQVVKKNV